MIANPLERYTVRMVAVDDIKPSPENDEIYGPIVHDAEMDALIKSIGTDGMAEPPMLTADNYVLSGHRRFYAVKWLGWDEVPVKYHPTIRREGCADYHRRLAEYNPQRSKTVGARLREALLRDNSAEDTYTAIRQHQEARSRVDVDFMEVEGEKAVRPITGAKGEFLRAVRKVVFALKEYWPLSIRQVHYNLLNDPPLTSAPKDSRFSEEHYRYRNDKSSYQKLVRLLGPARYEGHIPMAAIDDPTRPQINHRGYDDVAHFVSSEVENFLEGYYRDRQADQPRHIELFGEKNTLLGMLRRVAHEYHVPLTLSRGFCSVPVWQKIADRFGRSGKAAMTLIVVSDFDPEGLELADDAIRSLRQSPWNLPVDGHRVAVERHQIDELGLAGDFNPAKVTSSRFSSFVKRTGSDQTWECEALPPAYLVDQVKAAVEAHMDMDVFRRVLAQEREDCEDLFRIKRQIAGELEF